MPNLAQQLMRTTTSIALVGVSQNPERASHRVARYLIEAGYTLYLVNPQYQEVLGLPCYPNLSAIPAPLDMVDIFRRSEDCLPVVEEAVQLGAKSIWLQLGISNPQCRALAAEHGIDYVEDKCTKIEHANLR